MCLTEYIYGYIIGTDIMKTLRDNQKHIKTLVKQPIYIVMDSNIIYIGNQ